MVVASCSGVQIGHNIGLVVWPPHALTAARTDRRTHWPTHALTVAHTVQPHVLTAARTDRRTHWSPHVMTAARTDRSTYWPPHALTAARNDRCTHWPPHALTTSCILWLLPCTVSVITIKYTFRHNSWLLRLTFISNINSLFTCSISVVLYSACQNRIHSSQSKSGHSIILPNPNHNLYLTDAEHNDMLENNKLVFSINALARVLSIVS
jgi:hypothetical protein